MTPWGYHLVLDLKDCDPGLIASESAIREWVVEICDLIKMTRYGEPLLVRFGKDPAVSGYSLCQFIEESNITGHFIEAQNAACLDIFSCKRFDYSLAANFSRKYFGAKEAAVHTLQRLISKDTEDILTTM